MTRPAALDDAPRAAGTSPRLRSRVLLHPVRGVLGLSLLLAVLAQGVASTVPRVVQEAIDGAIDSRGEAVRDAALLICALAVLSFALSGSFRYGLGRAASRVEAGLRADVQSALTAQSSAYHDRAEPGQLVSRANSDIRVIAQFLVMAPSLLTTLLGFSVALVFMLRASPLLTLVAVLPLPFMAVVSVRIRQRMFPAALDVQGRTGDLAAVVAESVSGAAVVTAFAASPARLELFRDRAGALRGAALHEIGLRARFQPLLADLPRLGLVGVLLVGGHLALRGELSVGQLVAFQAYVGLLQTPFRVLGWVVMLAQRSRAAKVRVGELLDAPHDVVEDADAAGLPDGPLVLELRDVRFGYAGAADVLRGVDLVVRPGEVVALVGRTGCGKSSLLRLVPRLYDVRAGSVLLGGVDVRRLRTTELRSAVGAAVDEPFLFSRSVHDNIAFGRPAARADDVRGAARTAAVDDVAEALPEQWDTVVGERGMTLSGGQRQRLALARTLLPEPRVLLLDDATSALDASTERRVHDALSQRSADRTVLVVAHRLSTVLLADRVALLEDGRVVAEGTHAQLSTSEPRYAALLGDLDRQDAVQDAVQDGAA